MNLYAFFSIIQLLLQLASVNSFILPAAPSNILARKNNEDSKNNNRLLHIGKCINPDQHIHTETVIVENGGLSTLNGTLEVHIDAPIKITCVIVEDLIASEYDLMDKAIALNSGGIGYNWVFVDAQGQYGQGLQVRIHIFGVPDYLKMFLENPKKGSP